MPLYQRSAKSKLTTCEDHSAVSHYVRLIGDHFKSFCPASNSKVAVLENRVNVRWTQLQKQFIFQGTRLLCYTSCV